MEGKEASLFRQRSRSLGDVDQTTQSRSFRGEVPRSPQHDVAPPRSSEQASVSTLKTASVDTDSASLSARTSPAPASPTARVPSLPVEPERASGQAPQVAIKMLVSNSASGLIIGRSGSTVSDLQKRSRTRIKLSQGGDYYPGTSDRVCLIQGSLKDASLGVEMVLAKLYELQSSQHAAPVPDAANADPSTARPEEKAPAPFIVRLLVPSTCCGMIIGRGGSNVKALKERSGVTYIQLSPKEHEVMVGGTAFSTSERIMTITGPNFGSCVDCVKIMLDDFALNPEISRYINMTTSYSKNLAAVAAAASAQYALAPPAGFYVEHEHFPPPHYADLSLPPMDTAAASSPQRGVVDAMAPASPSYPQYHLPPGQSPGNALPSTLPPVDALARDFQARASLPGQRRRPSTHSGSGPMPATIELAIPDAHIGSILGRGGRTLDEIQMLSRTRIRISPRGEFVAGTRDRAVSIAGGSARDVERARELIERRLAPGPGRTGSMPRGAGDR